MPPALLPHQSPGGVPIPHGPTAGSAPTLQHTSGCKPGMGLFTSTWSCWGRGGHTQDPLPDPGWVSPPLLPPPWGPRARAASAASHISSPCPCFAVPASPGGAWPEELVPSSLLGRASPSPRLCPPSALSSVAVAGPGSSTHSHAGTGNGASPAGPSSSPWVRMFLEITVGTGNARVGSAGWGELQLVPPPGLLQPPSYLRWACHCPDCPPGPGGRGCSWGRG